MNDENSNSKKEMMVKLIHWRNENHNNWTEYTNVTTFNT